MLRGSSRAVLPPRIARSLRERSVRGRLEGLSYASRYYSASCSSREYCMSVDLLESWSVGNTDYYVVLCCACARCDRLIARRRPRPRAAAQCLLDLLLMCIVSRAQLAAWALRTGRRGSSAAGSP